MRVLSLSVRNASSTTLKGRMTAATTVSPAVASAHLAEAVQQIKFLRSYLQVVNYPYGRFAKDQVIANLDAAISRCIQLASMALMQYVDDLYTKSFKVADVNDRSTLDAVFVKELSLPSDRALRCNGSRIRNPALPNSLSKRSRFYSSSIGVRNHQTLEAKILMQIFRYTMLVQQEY